jgi:16S rRNA (guanine(1405)-N(7))-methyltransferase
MIEQQASGQRTALDELLAAVLTSLKYQHIAPELVRSLGAQELAKRRNAKEAIKATKNKLHQIAGAYQLGRPDYAAWAEALLAAPDETQLRQLCQQIMAQHASTRERLPILADFYATLLADLPPIRAVLDLACGLNPLGLPWLGLPAGASYLACDIYQDQADFLNRCWGRLGVQGEARVCDLLHHCPTDYVDIALLLKTIPCLEQVDKGIGRRLLAAINAPVILVSFPVHSLGGQSKGMLAHYEAHFVTQVLAPTWSYERFVFATELVFRVRKPLVAYPLPHEF